MAFPKPSSQFLKIAGLLALFALAPISLSVLYYHFGGLPAEQELSVQRNLRFAFMKGGDTLDLTPLTPVPWVKACAITSDLTRAEVDGIVGFPYLRYSDVRWINRPEYWTLLIIEAPRQLNAGNLTAVTPVRIPRKDVADLALADGAKGQCIGRDSGRIEIVRATDAPAGTTPVTLRFVESGN